jgi:hypothetical protein
MDNQRLHSRISTLKGVPRTILDFILSWSISQTGSNCTCQAQIWAYRMSDPLPNHIPTPLNQHAKALASTSTTKWRGRRQRRTPRADLGAVLTDQWYLYLLPFAGDQGQPRLWPDCLLTLWLAWRIFKCHPCPGRPFKFKIPKTHAFTFS